MVTAIYGNVFDAAHAGMRQGELTRLIAERALAEGVGHFAIVSAGLENYDFCGAWRPDMVFAPGDMVWLDIGVTKGGWSMLFSRAGVIGGPSAEQEETAAAVHAATMAGVAACGPGVPISVVAAVCAQALAAVDAPVTTNTAELGTRYGHGIGIDYIEPPHVAAYDPTVLAPGMVIAIEPGIATSYGRFHFREVAVVTETGTDTLHGPPARLATLRS